MWKDKKEDYSVYTPFIKHVKSSYVFRVYKRSHLQAEYKTLNKKIIQDDKKASVHLTITLQS